MTSKTDSLQDIFGPTDGDSNGPGNLHGECSQTTMASTSANKVDDFDEIFGESNSAKTGAVAPLPGGEQLSGDSAVRRSPASATAAVDQSSLGPDDFDNIFVSSSPHASSGAGAGDHASGELSRAEATEASGSGGDGAIAAANVGDKRTGPGDTSIGGRGTSSDGDKAFLDFLYDGDKGNAAYNGDGKHSTASRNETGNPVAPEPSDGDDDMSIRSGGVSKEESGEVCGEVSRALGSRTVQRPLPADPARALRELIHSSASAQIQESEEHSSNKAAGEALAGDGGETRVEIATAAVEDVGYVRRLCAASGGFLPRDLRPAVWSLLLGLGTTTPDDTAFKKWREKHGQHNSSVESGATSRTTAPAVIQNKIDLHNDSLALARRLCAGGDAVVPAVDGSASPAVGAASGDSDADPEALAADIEQVLRFHCTRRSEAYEPVLSALVGPLFSLGLDAAAVSAMLYPLVGALTLFLGRGLTLAVRDLAWAHAHRRLHDLCTYHDPQLVQHLDRCFSGWEMPLPAASVSRAETSARDQEAAAMVDDLESSLGPSIGRRRQSTGRPSPAKTFAAGQGDVGTGEVGDEGTPGDEMREGSVAEKQGLIEPSLLVAACSGLGAAVPLRDLVRLWDVLLVRRDKHFGFFLILAALLRRRDDLLAATGPQLRRLLSEILSPEGLASAGMKAGDGDGDDTEKDVQGGDLSQEKGKEGGEGEEGSGDAKDGQSSGSMREMSLVDWCKEAEALDLATPESFRHHLALIGEIAEAEHEATIRSRGRPERNEPPSVSPSVSPAGTAGSATARNGSGSALATLAEPGVGPEDSSASSAVASTEASESAGGTGNSAGQNEDDSSNASAARGASSSSFVRMRYMMKSAGDRIAADFKSLKLTRTPSGSRSVPSSKDLAPPSELSLPQLCLAVSAKELVFRVSSGETHDERGDGDGEDAKGKDQKATGLFRQRRPLSFFAIDCRPKEQVEAGRLPKAYHMDPSAMENPEDIAETIMSVFEPLKGNTHLCLMGTGDGYIRSRGMAVDQDGGRAGARGAAKDNDDPGLGSAKAARDDYSYVNTCALFFIKRGFPYVSVLEGGYAAVHELVMDALSRSPTPATATVSRRGDSASVAGSDISNSPLFTVIVDYNPAACRLSLARSAPSITAGNSNSSSSSNNNNNNNNDNSSNNISNVFGSVMVAGMSFSGPSPIWARLGAADTSTQGLDIVAEGAQKSRKGNEQRSSSSVGDRVTNVFFPPQREVLRPQQGVPAPAARHGGVASGHGVPGKAEGAGGVAGGTEAGGSAASLFKTGAVFRGMNVNNLFKSSAPSRDSEARADAAARVGAGQEAKSVPGSTPDSSNSQAAAAKTQASADITSKIRMSFGRFSTGAREVKRDAETGGSGAGAGSDAIPHESSKKDSGFGSLFRKAQAFKPADVAAAFTDLRDGPKTFSRVNSTPSNEPQPKAPPLRGDDEDEEDDGEGLFVIGDDGSESSEAPDSDFEGFDGEHRPPSSGGARSEADKALALLEHRLSGQVKGGTMVVEEFLKVPGAKMFTVTKHKVTFHNVDAAPPGDSSISEEDKSADSEEKPKSREENEMNKCEKSEGGGGETEASSTEGTGDVSTQVTEKEDSDLKKESVRVRAVTELERLIFLSRERILVIACPDGPRSPGLVKSNHHLTELQKMTFLRRDPTLVTLHYIAFEGQADQAVGVGGGAELSSPRTKRNVYRFAMEDKETFIRLIRGALQRFQT